MGLPGVPVATLIARGEADIGFQQLSELLHEPGVEVVGALQATKRVSAGQDVGDEPRNKKVHVDYGGIA